MGVLERFLIIIQMGNMKEFPHNGHVSAGLRFCTSFGGVLYLEQEHTHYASTEMCMASEVPELQWVDI